MASVPFPEVNIGAEESASDDDHDYSSDVDSNSDPLLCPSVETRDLFSATGAGGKLHVYTLRTYTHTNTFYGFHILQNALDTTNTYVSLLALNQH